MVLNRGSGAFVAPQGFVRSCIADGSACYDFHRPVGAIAEIGIRSVRGVGASYQMIYIAHCLPNNLHPSWVDKPSSLVYDNEPSLLIPDMSIKQLLLTAALAYTVLSLDEVTPLSCTGPIDTQCCKNKVGAACTFEIGGIALSGNCVRGTADVSVSSRRMRKRILFSWQLVASPPATFFSCLPVLKSTTTDFICFRASFLVCVTQACAHRPHRVCLALHECRAPLISKSAPVARTQRYGCVHS